MFYEVLKYCSPEYHEARFLVYGQQFYVVIHDYVSHFPVKGSKAFINLTFFINFTFSAENQTTEAAI